MTPSIKITTEKKLVGIQLAMSLAENRTAELWKKFMPRRKEISHCANRDLISMQVYDSSYFLSLNPNKAFTKWALVEVNEFENIPTGMEKFILPGGLYAIFNYKGLSTDSRIFEFIFGTWIPNSNFLLDDRPHFEVLGDRYKNGDENSEEEIWIPIRDR